MLSHTPMTRSSDVQHSLFELPAQRIAAVPARHELEQLRDALADRIRLGAMTWSYRGWVGSVYARDASEQALARYGLTAYAQHPLLSLAEIDRTYYEPLSADVFQQYADQVPEHFQFLVKAHELCTIQRFPRHARYGQQRGLVNELFLDVDYAIKRVIEPALAGLGGRLLTVLWQFSPQDASDPRGFAERLGEFLLRLPKTCRYAVELRNPELLTREYGAALHASGATHCHNAWTAMPSVLEQARATPVSARHPLLIRWLLRPGERFEQARTRYLPFDRIVAEDLQTRHDVVTLVTKAHAHGVPAYVLVDNKAEGSAPESIIRLSQAIRMRLESADRPALGDGR